MNESAQATVPIWHVIESGDRWHQAVLRFVEPAFAQSPGSIRRWDPTSISGLIASVRKNESDPVVLLWELSAEPKILLRMLEAVATFRSLRSRAVQLTHVPPRCSSFTKLVLQEAGASFLLDDLGDVEKVVGMLRLGSQFRVPDERGNRSGS